MAIKRSIAQRSGLYYITFTCCSWIPLFELIEAYDLIYKQLDKLKDEGHHVIGYVIMPDHLHLVVRFNECGVKINTRIGNLKRFLAYDIIWRLEKMNKIGILGILRSKVSEKDRTRRQEHRVFERSFDIKECFSLWFLHQKLNYIHNNPVVSKKTKALLPENYDHSSARFYFTGVQGEYEVTHYNDL
jgi:REP element-mobilizing transposase RayT